MFWSTWPPCIFILIFKLKVMKEGCQGQKRDSRKVFPPSLQAAAYFGSFSWQRWVSSTPFAFPAWVESMFWNPAELFTYSLFTFNSKYFGMVCYLEWETTFGTISFEVQWNKDWTDNIKSFKLSFELPFYLQIKMNLLDLNVMFLLILT